MNLDDEVRKFIARGPNRPLPSRKTATVLAASLDQVASSFAFRIFNIII